MTDPAAALLPVKYDAAEAKVKAILPNLIADVVIFQSVYFTEHGRYWQGLSSHAAVPDEFTPTAADKLDRAPADRRYKVLVSIDHNGKALYRTEEDDTWADTGINVPGVCSVSVSDYNGPLGHGYVVTAEIMVGDDTVSVVRPYGPETYRKSESLVRLKEEAL